MQYHCTEAINILQMLHQHWWHQMYNALNFITAAAAAVACLQYRCTEAINILQMLHQHWWHQMQMLTATESNPEVLAEGAVSAAAAAAA
jgi:hypothetical protein